MPAGDGRSPDPSVEEGPPRLTPEQLYLFGAGEPRELLDIYSAILESAPDSMVVVDTQGRIVFINEQTVRLFGHRREELIGETVEILVPGRFREMHPMHREEYTKNPHFRAMGAGLDLYGRRRDGSEFPVEISLSPIRFKDRLFVAAAIRDATERKSAQRSRQLANERLQRIQRLEQEKRFKEQFLNMVSHELNTPVTPLKLQLHLLERHLGAGRAEKAEENLKILKRNMDRLARLIGDILDVSRLEAGRLKVNPQETDLGGLLQHACESFQSNLDKRDKGEVRISLRLPEEGTLEVVADPDRLHQVFDNLLANAVRLSPRGGKVTVSVSCDDGEIIVRVQDEGPGLTEDQISMLFRPFSQVHDASRERGGTGLGLYVSRGIVKTHGGDVEASSPGPGKGAVFTVRLPRDPSAIMDDPPDGPRQAPEPPAVNENASPDQDAATYTRTGTDGAW